MTRPEPMPAWRKRLEGCLWWLYGAQDLPLNEGETRVLGGVGSLLGALPSHGRIVLTTTRLLYIPLILRPMPGWPFERKWTEIPLATVVSVRPRSWLRGLWGGFPGCPVFTVELADGRSFTFQTLAAGKWRREIGRLARSVHNL